MIKITSILTAVIAIASLASAATINFSAQVANNAAGVGGAALAGGDLIEVGTWDSSAFTSLGSGSNDNISFGPGFFSNSTGKIATTGGAQLAFSWTSGGQTGIVFFDITTIGANATTVDNWTLKGGDGGGTDNNVNAIDLADLTVNGEGSALVTGATLINVEFAGENIAGVPSFALVPEPSTFAALAGFLALGCVALRRRN